MNTSLCPNCKTKLDRNMVAEDRSYIFVGACRNCGYSANVTADVIREDKAKVFAEGKLKEFLATCPKPGLNETIKRTYSEMKKIMQTDSEELADEILKQYIEEGKLRPFGVLGGNVTGFIIDIK